MIDNERAERFWAKVKKTDTCWNWIAGKSHGYGMFWWPEEHNAIRAYRVPFLLKGIDLTGMVVHHLCENRACVNPEHLALLSSQSAHGKLHAGPTCKRGHPRTPENRRTYNGRSSCIPCARFMRTGSEEPAAPKWTNDTIIASIQRWALEHGTPPAAYEWNGTSLHEYPALNTVQRHFGSWAAAIEASGFPRPRTGIRHNNRPGAFDKARRT